MNQAAIFLYHLNFVNINDCLLKVCLAHFLSTEDTISTDDSRSNYDHIADGSSIDGDSEEMSDQSSLKFQQSIDDNFFSPKSSGNFNNQIKVCS